MLQAVAGLVAPDTRPWLLTDAGASCPFLQGRGRGRGGGGVVRKNWVGLGRSTRKIEGHKMILFTRRKRDASFFFVSSSSSSPPFSSPRLLSSPFSLLFLALALALSLGTDDRSLNPIHASSGSLISFWQGRRGDRPRASSVAARSSPLVLDCREYLSIHIWHLFYLC